MPEPTAATAPLAAGPGGTGVKTARPRAWSWAALMHRAFGIDVLACAHCGGRLRLIATLAPPRPDLIGLGARQTPSCSRREVAFVLIRPVHRSIDGGGPSGLACRSPGPARSTREKVA